MLASICYINFLIFLHSTHIINQFKQSIRSKIGILFIYKNQQDIELIGELLFKLYDKEEILEIIKTNFTYAILEHTQPSVKELLEERKIKFIPPLTLFLFDSTGAFAFNSNIVLSKIEGFLEINHFCMEVNEVFTKKPSKSNIINNNNIKNNTSNQNNNNNNNNFNYNDFNNDLLHQNSDFLSPAELLEKQNLELQEMEREAQRREVEKKKEEKLKQMKIEENKKLEESLKKKVSTQRRNKENLKKNLLSEPDKGDQNSSTIIFRLPDGSTLERRFQKYWKIIELYYFIGTLDHVLTEEENTDFDLLSPFPMKVFDNLEATIESEGLYPNAVLQVREK